ncbi:MAG: hypothetical protein ACM3NQ_11660 [Bacteroidales bacterium]
MRHAFAALLVVVTFACGPLTSPPDKEMNQARGAIKAARAAGADAYAIPEYQAALASLKRSEDAVAQRDFRQALNFALDSREQAENAARAAADGKAAARSQAERQLHDTETALQDATARLNAIDAARGRRRPLTAERSAIASAEQSVQKARTAMAAGDFIAAREATTGGVDQLRAAIQGIEQAIQPQPARRRQ